MDCISLYNHSESAARLRYQGRNCIDNPARHVRLRQPKPTHKRRVLTSEEISWLLNKSAEHSDLIYGGVGVAVRLGLYAGLRKEEIIWLKKENVDLERGIVVVCETTDEETGERWVPKDGEIREVDIKRACVEYLHQHICRSDERNPWVLRGRNYKRRLGTDSIAHAFVNMLSRETNPPEEISLHCLRHTFATELLRSGVDIRTVQARLGHSDLRTTEHYLHALRVEEHSTDALPYRAVSTSTIY